MTLLRPNRVMVVLAALIVATTPLVAGVRLARASTQAAAASRMQDNAERLVQEIARHSTSQPWLADESPVPADLSSRVVASLEAAQVPRDRIKSIRQAPDRALASEKAALSTPIRQRTVTIVLGPVTLPEVGAILAAWRLTEPSWCVSMIDLQHDAGTAHQGTLRMDVTRTYAEASARKSPRQEPR